MRLKDFQGFRFGKIHSSDLHLEVVSSSNRYDANLLPTPTDIAVDITGSDGQYLFGSIYKNREFTVNVAFDKVSEEDYRKIRQLFATDTPQDLVFDEAPYKTWKAKLKSKPEFKSLCFIDKDSGQRVYKGDGKLVFICYSPYAFGFDKYVVRAADYYLTTPPETILCEISNEEEDFFIHATDLPACANTIPPDIKYHYNSNPHHYLGWEPNDKKVWKGGFPTIEQVQNGELYFDLNGEKTIVETKAYWNNIPEWESAAKLLTTPTLDFNQELMYLPQYSKIDYINMEVGFESSRPMIGSRLLVYNPGDLPIDWELKLEINNKGFWSSRGGKFRVRRFNVQRLTIPEAVDWCGLTTYDLGDNSIFKYGDKYFKRHSLERSRMIEALTDETNWLLFNETIAKSQEDIEANPSAAKFYSVEELVDYVNKGVLVGDKQWIDYSGIIPYWNRTNFEELHGGDITTATISFLDYLDLHLSTWDVLLNQDLIKNLKKAHPHWCYYAEPIPKEKLDHYIKLFYWQTLQKNPQAPIDFEEGIAFANRYREMMDNETNEHERNRIYWDTLSKLIGVYEQLVPNKSLVNNNKLFYQYVNHPLEYIDKDLFNMNYDEEVFNGMSYPAWITQDYLEIDAEKLSGVDLIKEYMAAIGSDIQEIFTGHFVKYERSKIEQNIKLRNKMDKLLKDGQYLNDLLDSRYYLNSETRMLYSTPNPNGDFYHYKPTKNVMNGAITKGTWFKLPPGWSLIAIEPIVDSMFNNGKRWLDARPFDWGYGGDRSGRQSEAAQLYDYIFDKAIDNFLDRHLYSDDVIPDENKPRNRDMEKEEKIRFNLWYENTIENAGDNEVIKNFYYHKRIIAEFELLNTINILWQTLSPYFTWTQKKGLIMKPEYKNIIETEIIEDYTPYLNYDYDANGRLKRSITGDISDWWWYACNYIWANFPPLYWAAADCFNDIKIKYTPLFY